MADKIYTVYLSSTLKDLRLEREAVAKVLGDECIVRHSYGKSHPTTSLEPCLRPPHRFTPHRATLSLSRRSGRAGTLRRGKRGASRARRGLTVSRGQILKRDSCIA